MNPQAALRYYVYISDAKLDMLFEQIDLGARRKFAADLKVDLQIASLSISRAQDPLVTRMAKLRLVERYIETHCDIGTVSDPGHQFFRGTMELEWWRHPVDFDGRFTPMDAVVWRGRADNDLIVLGGSVWHVIGMSKKDSDVIPRAIFASILPGLVSVLGDADAYSPRSQLTLTGSAASRRKDAHAPYFLKDIFSHHIQLPGAIQKLDFLAVPLAEEMFETRDGTHAHGVLASPIYVSHAH